MANNLALLKVGANNDKETVKQVQKLLNEKIGAGLVTDGIYGPKTLQAVKNYQSANSLVSDGIVGEKTWASLLGGTNQTAAVSDPVAAAKKKYEDISAQEPGEFRFADQGLYDQAEQAYLNRKAFAYDLGADPLYQQYAQQYTTAGMRAMEDTMGRAAALTGGYGNSYAQTAGQQAYGSYLQQLNEQVPALYELAYSKYQQEGQELRDRYDLLRDKWTDAYGMYQDTLSRYSDKKQQAYSQYQDALAQQLAQEKLEYEKSQDARDWQSKSAQIALEQQELEYMKQQDALEQQEKAFTKLKNMIIQDGYTPTGRDLDIAGMTRKQAEAFMKKRNKAED